MNGTRKNSVCQHPGGCDRPLKSANYCRAHWDRLKVTGNLGTAAITKLRPVGRECQVEECTRPVTRDSGNDMCGMHYQRWRKHGNANTVAKGGCRLSGETSPVWAGNEITYSGAHQRIRNIKGPASSHRCVDCGGKAAHWSYNHRDPDERVDAEVGRYSSDPSFYESRCVSCHSWFDRAERGVARSARP